ncbi:hypothetical protein BO78DRAFT_410733 [Aspergillus sclerotiicarbonarius CBS 121057]|uniref:Uncharacterized protein n=1 Tax=Aspergillus sclerotiicarbonarius (strain CBS 121057 / IBT 28362) TaxID=1448318 RepID=A0A319DWX9_ASPSB|nr:hypothetical protein BO78DRAFT_410733 [Aspergillus sclerotiicarbonarius CBS 121057]
MPITLILSETSPQEWSGKLVAEDGEALFTQTSSDDYLKSKRNVESSFQEDDFKQRRIIGGKHGFIQAVYEAYGTHARLTIRPEDIWFSVLSQLNLYLNTHPQARYHLFVQHPRQAIPPFYQTEDDGDMAICMEGALATHITDPELRAWAVPSFSTTTGTDRAVASALLLGNIKRYFQGHVLSECDIHSVTLLGERKDWGDLLSKLDKIETWDEQLKSFAISLRPILRRFITSFDGNTSEVSYFWKCCLRENCSSGSHILAGWITAFCFWDVDGKRTQQVNSREEGLIRFDGVVYLPLVIHSIPAAFGTFPVSFIDQDCNICRTMILAGLVGFEALHNSNNLRRRWDRLQPISGWWMYEEEVPIRSTPSVAKTPTAEPVAATMASVSPTATTKRLIPS